MSRAEFGLLLQDPVLQVGARNLENFLKETCHLPYPMSLPPKSWASIPLPSFLGKTSSLGKRLVPFPPSAAQRQLMKKSPSLLASHG